MNTEQALERLKLFKQHIDLLGDGRNLILTDGTESLPLNEQPDVGSTEVEQQVINCIHRIRTENIRGLRELSKLIQTRMDEVQSPLTFELARPMHIQMINTTELLILHGGLDKIQHLCTDEEYKHLLDMLVHLKDHIPDDHQITECLALLANIDDKPKVINVEYAALRQKLLSLRNPLYHFYITEFPFWLMDFPTFLKKYKERPNAKS